MELFTNNDWEYFKNGKIAVNCKTEELAKEFLDILRQEGYKWPSWELDTKTYWNVYTEETCYRLWMTRTINYSELSYYKDEGIVIKSWESEVNMNIKSTTPEVIQNTYTQQEIIREFYNNPKIRVRQHIDIFGNETGDIIWYVNEYGIITSDEDLMAIDTSNYNKSRYQIIEPSKELKKISLQEMAKYYSSEIYNYKSELIKSVVTGRKMTETFGFTLLTEEEINGLWTVNGVYE